MLKIVNYDAILRGFILNKIINNFTIITKYQKWNVLFAWVISLKLIK